MLKPKIRFKKLFSRKTHAELEDAPSLIAAPAVGDGDEAWLPSDNPSEQAGIIGRFNGWHQHLLKTTRGAMMETNIAARPLRSHPGLRHLLKYHRANQERANYWGSHHLLGVLKQRQDQFLTYRIELNPAISEQIDIFAGLMQHCEDKGLAVAGSILDRRAVNRGRSLLATPTKRLRTDGIVLLTGRENINALLELSFAYRRETLSKGVPLPGC